jgi:hypothetical protein
LKRMFNFSSPLGIALTVAGVVLALSPDARRATRKLLVKGTAAVLGAVDQVKDASNAMAEQVAQPVLNTPPSPQAMDARHEEVAHQHEAATVGFHAVAADADRSQVQRESQ